MIWPFSRPLRRVLIVCTANVCRSPAAEALLRHHLHALGLSGKIAVSSAGTEVAAPGRAPDPRVAALATEQGISVRGIRAKRVKPRVLARADAVWVMEEQHREALLERFPEAASKVTLLDPAGAAIADPYFGSRDDVRRTFEQLNDIARARASALQRECSGLVNDSA